MQGNETSSPRIFIANTGYYIVSSILNDGTESIQYIGGAGSTFGNYSTFNNRPYLYSAKTITECEGYFLSGKQRTDIMSSPNYLNSFLMLENTKCQVYSKRVELLAIPKAKSRLLFLLLGFAASIGEPINNYCSKIPLPLTHQLLSEILLIDRVTTSKYMSLFTQQKVICKIDNHYHIFFNELGKIYSDIL